MQLVYVISCNFYHNHRSNFCRGSLKRNYESIYEHYSLLFHFNLNVMLIRLKSKTILTINYQFNNFCTVKYNCLFFVFCFFCFGPISLPHSQIMWCWYHWENILLETLWNCKEIPCLDVLLSFTLLPQHRKLQKPQADTQWREAVQVLHLQQGISSGVQPHLPHAHPQR